ncbi:hypothetical protein ANCCAN_03273 [Ancylostoma caninum]|uniref:Uncharacterized protein n=1 Tax=Ancylostoma caninum TaxID=29170 RepID=A0A368H5R9_ANCCA|nr:hypothetical protein ANCCAN_03273 [Ancylostoma caninum]
MPRRRVRQTGSNFVRSFFETGLEETDTADDLPLNAEVVLEVDEGNIELATAPKIPVILDSFEELRNLQKRDKLFFNKALLFGNTVRSMINLSDMTSVRVGRPTRRSKAKPRFTFPTMRYYYRREKWWRLKGLPYTSKEKDSPQEEASTAKSSEPVRMKPSDRSFAAIAKNRQQEHRRKGEKKGKGKQRKKDDEN